MGSAVTAGQKQHLTVHGCREDDECTSGQMNAWMDEWPRRTLAAPTACSQEPLTFRKPVSTSSLAILAAGSGSLQPSVLSSPDLPTLLCPLLQPARRRTPCHSQGPRIRPRSSGIF